MQFFINNIINIFSTFYYLFPKPLFFLKNVRISKSPPESFDDELDELVDDTLLEFLLFHASDTIFSYYDDVKT